MIRDANLAIKESKFNKYILLVFEQDNYSKDNNSYIGKFMKSSRETNNNCKKKDIFLPNERMHGMVSKCFSELKLSQSQFLKSIQFNLES